MNKYRDRVPSEMSHVQVKRLVEALPGFDQRTKPTQEQISDVLATWKGMYDENLEKVIFDNLSSYEP